MQHFLFHLWMLIWLLLRARGDFLSVQLLCRASAPGEADVPTLSCFINSSDQVV
jgi:hypothetical protein